MTEYLFTNNAETTLQTDIGGSDITFDVVSGGGALFPEVISDSGKGFYILMEDGSTSEWMLCTVRTGDSFTVTRTESNSFTSGASIKLAVNSTILGQMQQKGVFREVTSDPDGNLDAEYLGEEVLQTVTNVWWKHCVDTTWKVMA